MTEQQQLPPKQIAFVIDNKVIDVLYTDERLAAIFLSDPIVIDVTGPEGAAPIANVNWNYDPDTHTFTPGEGAIMDASLFPPPDPEEI